jgi:hypothetical protein
VAVDGWWPSARRDRWLWGLLACGLAARLLWLHQPLVDQQAWRQTDTAAIARSFWAEGYHLLYPRVEWRGTSPGYVESEFPLYPFSVALVYGLLGGVHEGVGRALSALAFTAAALLVYGLAVRLYGVGWAPRLAAFWFLASPYGVYFGRAFMPEALMMLFSVGAILAFLRYTEVGGRGRLVLAAAAAAGAFLVKIPTLYLGFPLVAVAGSRWGWRFLRRADLWLFLAAVLLPPALWYWHAHGLFLQTGLTFGIWNRYGYDKWAGAGADLGYWWLMAQRLAAGVLTPIGLAVALLGAWYSRADGRRSAVTWAWVGGLLVYLALVPEGNRRLEYYQLPFLAPGALLAGRALAAWLSSVPSRLDRPKRPGPALTPVWRYLVVALVMGVTVAWSAVAVQPLYRPGGHLYDYYSSCYQVGAVVDARLPGDALLVVIDLDDNAGAPFRSQSPTMLYYCRRKGWQLTPDQLQPAALDSLAAAGAAFALVPGGLVRDRPEVLADLYRRGVSLPSAYPDWCTDGASLAAARRSVPAAERSFLLVRLGNAGRLGPF